MHTLRQATWEHRCINTVAFSKPTLGGGDYNIRPVSLVERPWQEVSSVLTDCESLSYWTNFTSQTALMVPGACPQHPPPPLHRLPDPKQWDSNLIQWSLLEIPETDITTNNSTNISRSRDGVFGIATAYRLDDRGVTVRVPVGSWIFSSPRRPERLSGPPSPLSNGYQRLFPRRYSGRGVKLTTHLQLVPRSRKFASINPLYHMPSWRNA
jgi:hypothetical protein